MLGTLKYMLATNATDNDLDAEALRSIVLKRNQLQKDYLDQWISTGPIDGLISPVAVAAAFRLQLEPTLTYAGFTGFANLLGMDKFFNINSYHLAILNLTTFSKKKTRPSILHLSGHVRKQDARPQERINLAAG